MKRLTPTQILARKITRSLFTNGEHKRAVRLQLKLKRQRSGGEEVDGGGWCESAMALEIERILLRASGFMLGNSRR